MQRSMSYILKGNPTPLARHRTNKDGHIWDSQSQLKLIHGLTLRQQHKDEPLFLGPLSLTVTFFMPIAKSRAKKNLPHYHHVKPDIDNLIKFVSDVSNEIIFKDDAQICSILAEKRYSVEPCTKFTIAEIIE